jgi:uncharacterized LabA/DUF88 family protein
MDKCVILVDNSNIYIEGGKLSAKVKGVAKKNPMDPTERQPVDPSWRLDFGRLLAVLADGRAIQDAILVGSRPPKNDGVWAAAKADGFEVFVHDRGADNREKAVDTELVVQGTEIIVSSPDPMALVIASGDRDFIPLVRLAGKRGWEVEMAAFSSAFDRYGLMATEVNKVRPLDAHLAQIGHCEFDWPFPGGYT